MIVGQTEEEPQLPHGSLAYRGFSAGQRSSSKDLLKVFRKLQKCPFQLFIVTTIETHGTLKEGQAFKCHF